MNKALVKSLKVVIYAQMPTHTRGVAKKHTRPQEVLPHLAYSLSHLSDLQVWL